MSEKKWHLKPVPETSKVKALASALNVAEPLATLLLQRGIDTFDLARDFFRPELQQLHDPFLMKDMQHAVDRLVKAVNTKEKILVYGDYDVDGTTSVALVYNFLARYHKEIDFYIPDRHKEGYGISYVGIDWANEHGYTLIISLDCGIKSPQHIEHASKLGIDFIICDHHNPGEVIPKAVAVLDPKQKDCRYPYKELSGCGVGFKLLQAFCAQKNISQEELYPSLDLVAVSICADIVPITGENRILTWYGLKQLNKSPRPGLEALIQFSAFKKELNVSNVVFGIAPRINAAGRIKHARDAVKLLLAGTLAEAAEDAKLIDSNNLLRRDVDSRMTEEALELITQNEKFKRAKSTVLYKEDWHKGVIGIVASRCMDHYYRPTIILTQSEGKVAGSARSVWGFDVYEAIAACSDHLIQFGGHMYAAGLTMYPEQVESFRERFEEVVSSRISDELLIPRQEIDLELPLSEINYKLYNIIRQMAPFGPENMQPVFMARGVQDIGSVRLLKDQHLKMKITQEGSAPIDVIGFGMPQHFERIKKGEKFNVCFTLEENDFQGQTTLQLVVKGIQFS